jgi:Antirepressor regulating drug resistance, predicted signal transduction N-terminal membrane component
MKTLNILLEITIYSGILFCAILLLKWCFKNRMSPFLHFVIWGLLIARLLIPATLESSFHLFVIPAETQNAPVQEQSQSPVSNPDAVANTNTYNAQPQTNGGRAQAATTPSVASGKPSALQQTFTLSTEEILLAVWLTGAGIGLLYLAALYGVLRKRIQRKAQAPSKRLLELFAEVKAELNIKRDVKIIGQCEYGTPALLFPNTVLMPINALVSMSDDEVKFVLRHELMHFKRCDHIMGLLISLLNAIYWFNPIVWLAFKQMHADMETACDSDVVRHLSGREKTAYAALILSLFSRAQYGNLALGMARGNARKIAEKRIRGVFMNNKSNRKVKIMAILLTSLLLFTCFTTACQPTPEKTVVQQKGSNSSEQANAVVYNKPDFPDSYKDRYSKNGADIVFDATVELPGSDSLPAYEISHTEFSQDQVNTIIKGLFGSQQLYAPAQVTKSELEPAYLQALSDLKNKQDHPDQYENTLEYYQEQADSLKEQIENAPGTDTLTPADNKLKAGANGESFYSCRGDLGKDQMAMLMIVNKIDGGDNSYLEFRNGNQYADMSIYYPDMQDSGPAGLDITIDEAITQANDIVNRIGAGDMKYSGHATGILNDENYQSHGYSDDFDPQIPQAYLLYYTRNLDGVPVSYDLRSYSASNNEESYSVPDMYERIMVAVDDSGVTYLRWQGPISVNNASAKNSPIIPFAGVMSLAKNQLSYLYAAYDSNQTQPSGPAQPQASSAIDNGKVVSNEVIIQKITLGLMQLPIKDENKSELVPVWDFFGYYQTAYESGAKVTYYKNGESLLTINAVDGSIIDRSKGY